MNWFSDKKSVLLFASFLLIAGGTYNSVVINGDSDIHGDDIHFAKRLDEVYGIVTPGRKIASTKTIKKVSVKPAQNISQKGPSVQVDAKATEQVAAAVQEELDLDLKAVDHPKKWAKGLAAGEFSGSLQASNGVIESLTVSLPEGSSISISFAEMSGNVFEYNSNGEIFSGVIYQVDQSTYMVTLSNGPLEGTRLRFSRNAEVEAAPEAVAMNEQEFQTVSFHF